MPPHRHAEIVLKMAISNSGFRLPMGHTTINLAPADIRKEGPSFDPPIALGMLAAGEWTWKCGRCAA